MSVVRRRGRVARRKGRIADWKDERGFGFIAPSTGGAQTFVHISSFANRSRRPTENDLVTYEVAADSQGRARAARVEFVGEQPKHTPDTGPVVRAAVVSATFIGSLVAAIAFRIYPAPILAFYIVMNLVAFVMYWYDKSAARTSRWRTRENTLHAIDLLGGWPGALVAMQVFRHKSSKATFRTTFWVTVIVNCAILFWLGSDAGAKVLTSLLSA